MRLQVRPVMLVAAVFASLVVVPVADAASAAPGASYPATARIVVAPVTSSGHAAAGFAVHSEHPGYGIGCDFVEPSPGALSRNVELCSPSAAYAIACWKSAVAHHVLCTRDPTKHKLVNFTRSGKFAATKVAKPRSRAPLAIVLTDGSKCLIRDGGAWGQPKGHPNLYGAYSCAKWGPAWLYLKGRHTDAHNGIDESHASWRIRTGMKNIVWRHIAKAYFVTTAP